MRCSNPSCRRSTAKADPDNPDNWVDLGIAAHVTAASSRGPRYDASLSTEQRRGVENGVWLCHHCAKEVDSAASAYSVETLRGWKLQAEATNARDAAATLDEVGRLVASIESARTAIVDYVSERELSSPVLDFATRSDGDWDEFRRATTAHGTETQIEWNARLNPVVRDILARAEGMLGSDHVAVQEASLALERAYVNTLSMRALGDALDCLRSHLLLR